MDDNRFLQAVWRFNAIAIASILILGTAIFVWQLLANTLFREHSTTDIVNVDEKDETIVEKHRIAIAEHVKGFDLVRLVLLSEQRYNHQYSSKSIRDTVINTGFHDPLNDRTNWLFPAAKQLITRVEPLSREIDGEGGKVRKIIQAYLVTFVDRDTSGDQRLSHTDLKSVIAIKPDGTKSNVVLAEIAENPTIKELGNNKFALFFKKADQFHSAMFDPESMSVGQLRVIARP